MSTPTTVMQNKINHVVFVLDASGSMNSRATQVVQVMDAQVQYLAQRSMEAQQETRISVFDFADRGDFKCLVYDTDVLRMPSLKGLYNTRGMTALIDATLQAIDDLALTPEKYGDHAFLFYVVTDGGENASSHKAADLRIKFGNKEARDLIGLPDFKLKVQPGNHTAFDIFVQSQSVNRHLVGNTKVLVFP